MARLTDYALKPPTLEGYGLAVAEQILRVWRGYGSAQGVKRNSDEYFAQTLLPEPRALAGLWARRCLAGASQLVVKTLCESITR